MTDANLEVVFTAATDDLEGGLADARDALKGLQAPIDDVNESAKALSASLGAMFNPAAVNAFGVSLGATAAMQKSLVEASAQANAAIQAGDDAAYADAARAARLAVSEEVKAVEDGLKQKLALYNDEAKNHQISENQKVASSKQALDAEYAAQLALLQQELTIGDLSLAQKQQIDNKILDAERQHQDAMARLAQQSLDAQQQAYEQFGNSITGAFNSQLHGLINGTTSWRTAFVNVLDDMLIKFIEWGETMVVRHIANELAQTASTQAGVAARTGAEASGATASLATQGATMIRSILSSAAESFAGVFGFMAPILGPAAIGPAAAAQATVAGVASSVASADIGMWQVPNDMLSLVHRNELIMPAAQAGAFRDMLGGAPSQSGPGSAVHIHPTTNFHVSAVDSGSVAQWMKANSPAMMKAMDEAVRHGAHLGLRRLSGA